MGAADARVRIVRSSLRGRRPIRRAPMAVVLYRDDLNFILEQIKIAEANAAGTPLIDLVPNWELPFGLRTISGVDNNLLAGDAQFGAADNVFPRLATPPIFRTAETQPADFFAPGTPAGTTPTSYQQTSGFVFDSQPRTISNLVVDQTAANPAAYATAFDPGPDGILHTADDVLKNDPHRAVASIVTGTRTDGTTFQVFQFDNVSPDFGLSLPFNQWMTFFGQFFDHGLDLVNKGGNGFIFIPLKPDDPLFKPGSPTNFMVETRATMLPGPDGILGTADDIHENTNQTSPFVDQNQTYSSHPSHQVFLRAYALDAAGNPQATGKLLDNRDLGPDGIFGTADDVLLTGQATWKVVKAQARDLLGIALADADVTNVPLLATDDYGQFIRGPHGFVQVVVRLSNGPDGLPGTADDVTTLVEGNPAAPIDLSNPIPGNPAAVVVRSGHPFLVDIAANANPFGPGPDGLPGTADDVLLTPDADNVVNTTPPAPGFYDNELLDRHFIAGDGRVNDNVVLTAVHTIFHSEHNRLVDQTKTTVLASGDRAFINEWLSTPLAAGASIPTNINDPSLHWNGERLFQMAKLGTEMQYQHLVFEEFARTIHPGIDGFRDYDATLNPAIVAEFAHTVFRFGHSMLLEQVDRLDPNFVSSDIGLIQAFLNPLAFDQNGTLTAEQATGAIVRGLTREVGNQIDEFVTEAVRNNLLGLPLDLPVLNITRGRDTGIPSLNAARRDFFDHTGDDQLAPYGSWYDYLLHLRHPESLVNFIAAYGTHPTITAATTLADKRAAAMAIVFGGPGAPADSFDFLHSQGAWASKSATNPTPAHALDVDGVSTTGLGTVDFWIGGLAEQRMPFGEMLGSTFTFVFESQLEALQNNDRLYYLHRTAGMDFLPELENNSFANLIMTNTDTTHLPGEVFKTPDFFLELDQTKQFNAGLGPDGHADPTGTNPLIPLVMRDNPDTVGPDTNYLRFNGDLNTAAVLGGTPGNDILIGGDSSEDTLYGDAGNDRLDGGAGDDMLFGGPGDDILIGGGGDDTLHGDDGNIVIGGPGKDFLVSGTDKSKTFADGGDDFVMVNQKDVKIIPGLGDDWVEGSSEEMVGDTADPLRKDLGDGNDVFLSGGFGDNSMFGEGGDDIMLASGAAGERFIGRSGFDWVSFKNPIVQPNAGVVMDADVRQLNIPVTVNGEILARFRQIEGLSGSLHDDFVRGDNAGAAQLAIAGSQGSALTNFDLIAGLRAFLALPELALLPGPDGILFSPDDVLANVSPAAGPDGIFGTADDKFDQGNIILGGDGSDILEGRGGNDLLDGDMWLNARISVRQNLDGTGPEIASFDSMKPLQALMVNGTYNPGQLVIVRELMPGTGGFDTAFFRDVAANYSITTDAATGITTVTHLVAGGAPVNPADLPGGGLGNLFDGTDRLTHFERLQFADQSIVLTPGLNNEPVGLLTLSDTTPTVGDTITVSAADITDLDNFSATNPTGAVTGPFSFFWQVETRPGSGVWEDILARNGFGVETPIGTSFTVPTLPVLAGRAIRAVGVYEDGHGVEEMVFSAPTAPVNTPPVGTVSISDTAPTVGELLTATDAFTDADSIVTPIAHQWQVGDGVTFTNILGAT